MLEDFENIGMLQFLKRFNTNEECSKYLTLYRWGGFIVCPFCESSRIYKTKTRSDRSCLDSFKCNPCNKKFTSTTKTLFHGSKIPLTTWFYLIYNLSLNKKSISSRQMAANTGLTQKTTWQATMMLRYLLEEKHTVKLSGIVEIDEAFVARNQFNYKTRWGCISTRKTPILGLIERGGKVVISLIPNRSRQQIFQVIKKHVEPGSTIYTDGWVAYKSLSKIYNHDFIEHSNNVYVRGNVHTNTIENVWSHLKKSIRNAHHFVSEIHLAAYCNEVAFRFNYRDLSFAERFNEILFRCLSGDPKNYQYASEDFKRKRDTIRGEFKGILRPVREEDAA